MYYTASICKDWITVANNHDEKVLAKQFIEMYLCEEQKMHKMERKKKLWASLLFGNDLK